MVAITAAPVAVVSASLRVAGAGTNARERRRQQAAAARRHTAAKRAMLGDLFWLGEAVTKNASDRSKPERALAMPLAFSTACAIHRD